MIIITDNLTIIQYYFPDFNEPIIPDIVVPEVVVTQVPDREPEVPRQRIPESGKLIFAQCKECLYFL